MDPPFLIKYRPGSLEDMLLSRAARCLVTTLPMCPAMSVLLLGPTGSGKTTMSSCIISAYYGDVDPNDLKDNILVINSLRDQGVHFYRSYLKAFCQTTCTIPGKRKTVVVDDVDTISPQCQEVIRHCLDAHSTRVNFVSSACNRHKIQEAIRSRSVTVKVPSPCVEDLRSLAVHIIEKEGISMDAAALDMLIRFSGRSFRLLINYLEKFVLLGVHVTVKVLKTACTNIHDGMFKDYLDLALERRDFPSACKAVSAIYAEGYSVMDILDGLFAYLKNDESITELVKHEIITSVCRYTTAYTILHEHEIELMFLTASICRTSRAHAAISSSLDA